MKNYSASLLVAVAIVVSGCSSPELIDRTQPNYIKKSDLDGTWYIKDSVIDVPKTSAASTVGYGGTLEKVRWEVHEDLLVGYRTYEFIPGVDPLVDQEKSKIGAVVFKDGRPYKGSPVVAYKITSHFDRQRQYNAATGEQSNILTEDSSDRPWYQREFMRVDWRNNALMNVTSCTGPAGTEAGCINGSGQYFRYVTAEDQNKQDNEFLTERNAKGELTYFDFTIEGIADPPTIYYEGYGNLPYCMFNPTFDCESALVRIRTSVKKVDQARVQDYEPLVYNDKLMKKFGYFRQEMLSYNKGYQYTESGRLLYAQRHNIWMRAHDEAGKSIPVVERALRPIVYYMSANTPKELHPAAKQLEGSWDNAFRRAVAVPRGLETSKVPQMFYVCESPVPVGAPEACGKPGTYVRLGDIRYNMIPYVEQITGGLLGLGPSSLDPETGEIVQAVANVYGPGLDSWSGNAQQVIDVLNGEIALTDLIVGKDIKDYVFANLNATDPRRPASGPWSSQQPLISESTRPMSSFFNPKGDFAAKLDVYKKAGHLPLRMQDRKAVVQKLIEGHPALESELINLPEIRSAVISNVPNKAFQAKLNSDSNFYRQVALQTLLGTDPVTKHRDSLRKRGPTPELGCLCELEFFDDDYLGLAKSKLKVYQAKLAAVKASGDVFCANKSACTDTEAKAVAKQAVWNELRGEAYRSIGEHEVGHTLGLMHNFIGSADPLNFKDGYWDQRKETIGVVVGGKRVLPVTPQNMLDASKPNQKQIDNSMYELQYSSIMDYGARMNAQIHGIGKYDEAAILFGYAGGAEPGWVEVFNEMRTDYDVTNWGVDTDNTAKKLVVRGAHVEIPLANVEHYTPVSSFITDRFHYTTLPFMFADKNQPFEAALDQGLKRMASRSFRKWSEMEAVNTRIEKELKNFNLSSGGFLEPDWNKARDVIRVAARNAPVEVPYMFCSDYEVGANVLCNTWDEGSDLYEMTSKFVERFETSYVWTNFRRDRYSFGINTALNGKARYLNNLPNVYQQWLFNIYFLQDAYGLTSEQMDEFFGLGDPIWQNYWTMAVTDSTNLLMRQLSTPSAGYHGKVANGNWVYLTTNKANNGRLSAAAEASYIANAKSAAGGGYTDVAYVPRGPGRTMFSVFDSNGYDGFTRINEVGHFWDQVNALSALTTSETNFLGVDRGSDALRYSLPYYITFNRELAPLFRDVWAENRGGFASSLAKLGDGTALVVPPTMLRADSYILGFNYPPPTPTPVDGTGNALPMEKVEATPTWSTRFYTQVWGMAYFTENFNQEFASFNQIYKLGSGEGLTATDNYTVVNFPDPANPTVATALPADLVGGYVYAGLKQNSGSVYVGTPAAVQLIDRANTQAAKYQSAKSTNTKVDGLTAAEWEGRLRESVRTMEIMRGLYDIFGNAW